MKYASGAGGSVQQYARPEVVKLALIYSVVSPFTCITTDGCASVTTAAAAAAAAPDGSAPAYSATAPAGVDMAYRYPVSPFRFR
jgi:hypothetical protein